MIGVTIQALFRQYQLRRPVEFRNVAEAKEFPTYRVVIPDVSIRVERMHNANLGALSEDDECTTYRIFDHTGELYAHRYLGDSVHLDDAVVELLYTPSGLRDFKLVDAIIPRRDRGKFIPRFNYS